MKHIFKGLVIGVILSLFYLLIQSRIELLEIKSENSDLKSEIVQIHKDNIDYKTEIYDLQDRITFLNELEFHQKLRTLIESDLQKVDYVSNDEKEIFIEGIFYWGEVYNVNPLIIYAIMYTESKFKSYMEHSQVYIKHLNKKIKAVGLGGIVYEYWKEELIKEKIIENRQDLFNPYKNIGAIAYIFSKYKSLPILPNAKNEIESALMRYYGSQFANYEKLIYNKIANVIILELSYFDSFSIENSIKVSNK